ncbi:MAG: long-chain fatty acid--CoA ligase [Actinomycetales bacterium]|nr:long-chain fatty acid--CoA ligase [Candidatus Phosphoribacter baldrii]MBK6956495.1 long-chain fatty acid--CoA ligase [Candidatus Phosphoribacter baldrii]
MAMKAAVDERVNHDILEGRARSIAALFRDRVSRSGNREAFQFFRNSHLERVTWSEARDRVYDMAAGLMAYGLAIEDRVAIASTTRYEWALADLAIMCAGGATTTVYPTTMAEDVAFILADSGSKVVFAEDDGQVEKLRTHRHDIPDVRLVVTFTGEAHSGDEEGDDWVISLADLEAKGRAVRDARPTMVDERIDLIAPDHLAVIIYTSGTTGRPKGAELTQDAIVYEAAAIHSIGILDQNDLQFLWLPLSHVFGKILLALPLQMGFPTAIDGKIDKIVDNLAVIKPTFMGAAPRIFEKAYARIAMTVEAETGIKRQLMDWALGVGQQAMELQSQGKPVGGLLAVQHAIADKLVLSKIRERFGGRVRFFISGSAALNKEIARWFGSVGLIILEGYGLTETSAATCVNRPSLGGYNYGTVGWPVPTTEVKLAEDGEILVKGPGVMRGYRNRPDANAEVFDDDGFFRTGDIGEIDGNGFVKITDRKKDLFKTSGGKYIAPSLIESAFKAQCPYASQMLVFGDGRNYATALITLDPDAITGWAAANRMAGKSYAEISQSQEVRDLLQGYLDTLNQGLNRWETIKRFTVLDRDLTVDAGELTPSLKLKRKHVAEKFKANLEALYD